MFLIDISCRFCVQCSEEGRTEVSVTGQAEEINVNGLNDVYKDLCDLVGVDNMQKLYAQYKGFQISFPMRLYSKEYVHQVVKKEYNGSNTKALARKLGYSERWIRKIVEEVTEKELSTNTNWEGIK